MENTFEYLIDALKSLPGVGTKQAKNIASFLILKDERYISEFIDRIKKAKEAIHFCTQCNNMTSNIGLCDICKDFKRDVTKLCIVNTSEDLIKIDATKDYNGLFFVLNSEIDTKKNKDIPSSISEKLIKMLKLYKFNEITIATNWTSNGEVTAVFLKKVINNSIGQVKIYRLAVGLPINSALEYADSTTIKHALKNKTEY
ncbi:MAG: toprim domain-containing protein [Mycoplasmataceae bacterium]|nr:toprim domain-containing protein [Mycoplasmataceae bacterium]